MTAEQLARRVLDVLDMQRDYFRASGPRKLELIDGCRKAERELRRACEEVVRSAGDRQPTLFPEEDGL